jgi:hypothetical protein
MADPKAEPILTFRCLRELEGWLPQPIPAAQGLPAWLKAMPAEAFNAIAGAEEDTVKRCPPFLDAMSAGFLIPLMCDVTVADGQLSWDIDLPASEAVAFPRSPLGFHDPGQVTGTPLFDADQFPIKFHNLWTIEAPEGCAVLFTHPFNRFDLPFTTLTGMVDCDRYHDAWIHFPAVWRDAGFSGVLPRGTPIAQCIAVRREAWAAQTAPMSGAEAQRTHDTIEAIAREKGVYRRKFRA